ncbi:UDP-N-acetylmuramoyl-L-alanine--D-glutamate ligase [Minwuia thermotolerans]|uniref:UDP-N-acetylmuramoylalanine--D-glutamate ligase n=1 Tax=Minwuia thermotolerans TaxID=2056226 RepID=A0A2M9G255_9PROT|nr:UDP-N-acetylmuramoyl-L-alanine--D-glutamate ligase [Minwuia thermotolerans]PJK29766.1 UDP-N-acetylmuramoyl-L-alanine--D-glutamate ligase [Minwuia thermotolerans]
MIALRGMEGKRIAVLGLGKSGLATVRAARAGGAEVVAWDDSAERRAALKDAPVEAPERIDWAAVDMLVPAPGIPLTHPEPHPAIRAATASGVEIAGDIELFVRACPEARVIGVTGTNGKSTTTALIGHVLTECRVDAEVGGNIGTAALDLEPPKPGTVCVLELSSYQLDLTESLKPKVSVLLNITPDHLDRHGGMAGYVAAKERLFARVGQGDTAVIGVDDDFGADLAQRLADRHDVHVVPVAVGRPLADGVYVLKGQLFDGGLKIMDLAAARALPGAHNHQNAAAAYAACRAIGCRTADIARAIASFPGLPHRIERIGEREGITFYNDSKATNAEAAARALGAFTGIYWIAGGKPKQGGLGPLYPFLDRVRRAYLIGEAEAAFADELEGRVETRRCGTLAAAVETAWSDARQAGSGVVLLSPACASFDQFPNFEARGDAFRAVASFIIERSDAEGAP